MLGSEQAKAIVLGLNQKFRIMSLCQYVESSDPGTLLTTPLSYFVKGTPKSLIVPKQLIVAHPKTLNSLNKQQQNVGHPLSIQTAMEVAGPPGTGKTKTITELIRSLFHCTENDVIVLFERNFAVDAIAEKWPTTAWTFGCKG